MSDARLRELERQAQGGDEEAARKLRRARERAKLPTLVAPESERRLSIEIHNEGPGDAELFFVRPKQAAGGVELPAGFRLAVGFKGAIYARGKASLHVVETDWDQFAVCGWTVKLAP